MSMIIKGQKVEALAKAKIDPENTEWKKGEIYEFAFRVTGIGEGEGIKEFIDDLYQDTRWQVMYAQFDGTWLDLQLKAVKNPFPVVAIVFSIIALAGLFLIWLNLHEVKQILVPENPIQSIPATLGITGIIALGVIGYLIFRRIKQ